MAKVIFKPILLTAIVAVTFLCNVFAQDLNPDFIKSAKKGDQENVQILLEKGASADAKDKKGRTALMLSSEKGHLDVVNLLLENGANMMLTDSKGETALSKAIRNNQTDVIILLEFTQAKEEHSIESYRQFIMKYPHGRYSSTVTHELAYLSFEEAKKNNSIAAYEAYMIEFPDSDSITAAKHNHLYLESKRDNSINSYESFLKVFPHSNHQEEIKRELEILYFQEAKKDSSINSCEVYLELYPNGKYVEETKSLLELASFTSAINTNTITSYTYFLENFPASNYSHDILENYEFLLYESIQETKDERLVSEYLQRFPNNEKSSKLRLQFDDIIFEKAKDDYFENIRIQKLEEYLTEYPKGKNVKWASKLVSEFRLVLPTVVATEDIHLLEKYLDDTSDSDISKQGRLVLEGQKALRSGNLENLDIERIRQSNSNYGMELVEIVLAIQSSSAPNILSEAHRLTTQGNLGDLFSKLIELQTISDNRLMRHTMAQFLYDASKNFKMPRSLSEVNTFQQKMSKYEEEIGSETLELGSINGNPDFGNLMNIIPSLTLGGRARSILTKIPMNEFESGRVDFNGVLQLMEQIGPLAGNINAQVVTGAKVLLSEQYSKHDIKGRYAILQWLEYLVEEASFGVTFQGRIDTDLNSVINREQNSFLKNRGESVLDAIKNAS